MTDFERVAIAVLLTLAATVALPLGAALGIYARPPQRLVAAVMAFGSGALIEALAVDLAFEGAERLVHEHHVTPFNSWFTVSIGFAIGGLAFYIANRMIEHRGGHLRKPSTFRGYIDRNRHRFGDILHQLHLDHLPRFSRHGGGHTRHVEQEHLAPVVTEHHGSGAGVAIFLGALLDGIPEGVVIGASFTTLAAFNPSFVVAVFLNNLPEAMSSAVGMLRGGFSKGRIFALWFGLMVACGIAAGLGNALLSGAPPQLLVFVNALAGGGILAMLAATMMPEAFEEGGPSVGLSTIAGFLAAFLFTTLSVGT